MNPDPQPLATITQGLHQAVRCPRCDADSPEYQLHLNVADLVRCRACGMSYVNPRLSPAELERKLQLWADQDVLDEERLRQAFEPATLDYYARFLRRIEARAPGRGHLLDVGCGTGAFLTVARQAGWRVQGVEVGVASSRHAREALGLDVQRGSLYDFEPAAGGYDAISLIEVIEHLQDPRSALQRIHGWLKPGGVLLVTTPNVDSLYRRLFGNRWWVINCEDEHIVLFNPDTLAGMLREQGFEVCETHLQNLDIAGLWRTWRGGAEAAAPVAQDEAVNGYYAARDHKGRIKRLLASLGMLRLARGVLRGLDRSYSWRFSPTRGWGEQIVITARRPAERIKA
ncbi:MAG: class I SAM-dependent methyltransferase [Pseudomonadota bacterium]